MELINPDYSALVQYLQQTLSPDRSVRQPAEKFLENIESTKQYPKLLLYLIENDAVDLTIRVAGSITFKNYVKRNWRVQDDCISGDNIHEADRLAIKQTIVALMLKSPPAIQKQLSDAISIIGKYDFPAKWPQLIDEMVNQFSTGDFTIINGVLQTAHSIFKRYRHEFKSQELWEEIKHVLDKFAKPLTDLVIATMELVKTYEGNALALRVIYSSLELVTKIFYSLNSQDLPEFFEDNMQTWMNVFHELLTKDVPCLHSENMEEAGILEQLRSQICDNLCLYAQKYDEEFGAYMPQFVTDVWELLVQTGTQTKYDILVSNAIKFLSTVADRSHYQSLFADPNVLASICEKIIIPNMDFRASDEELFEDNAEEYIRRDIEGSDIETRRRAACDLVKTLSQHFEKKIFEIFTQYLEILLNRYSENAVANWRAKDTAIFLVTTLAAKGQTEKHGVTQSSELVSLSQFYQQHIVGELERENINELPILKADAIKFIMTFRTVLGGDIILKILPQLIRHLESESVVTNSYAACTIDKIFNMRIPATIIVLRPLAGHLLNKLLAILEKPESTENEYVMKAIMRSMYILQTDVLPFMSTVLPRLTVILKNVARNPSKPQFNHYLFETLALSIKIICVVQPSATASFEEVLFPIFQDILQQDILEFIPYVFQILSLLLEVREGASAISEPYWALFPCLLSPTLWDRAGNVTPLIRLISAFLRQDANHISTLNKLNAILGVFQKMIASKVNDHEGFYLLQNLILYYPMNDVQQNMKQIFALLFQRLSLSKTRKYVQGLIVFFCFYAAKLGASAIVDIIDSIQAQMFGMVLERVFITDILKITVELDKKIVAIGISNILCDCPVLLQQPYIVYWSRLLQTIIELFEMPSDENPLEGDNFIEIEDSGYQAAYSQLHFAQIKRRDHFSDVVDGRHYLAQSISKISQQKPSEVSILIANLPEDHKQALHKYCAQAISWSPQAISIQ